MATENLSIKFLTKIFELMIPSRYDETAPFYLFLADNNSAISVSQETGKVIVSYRTDNSATRLNRIRFWIIDAQENRTMYPKRGAFKEDAKTNLRILLN